MEVFWYDEIKKLRSQPAKRLKMAMKNIPLPAAFREGQIACRAMIRERLKQGQPHEEMLQALYHLMAWEGLLLSTPYLEDLKISGFNVANSIPFAAVRELPMPYKDLGYEKLTANKTDVKWFVAAWGEPDSHVSAQQYHASFWNSYVDKHRAKSEASHKRFMEGLTRSTASDFASIEESARSLVRVVNESLKIANQSTNYETRVSRIQVVKRALLQLEDISLAVPRISLTSLEEIKNSIQQVEKETETYKKL